MGGSGGIAAQFLTSALDGGEWSASCPSHLTFQERVPSTNWIGGWLGPGCCKVEKNLFSQPGIKSLPSSHSASLYQLSYPSCIVMAACLVMVTADTFLCCLVAHNQL
jgi:hypothetical protein